MCMYVRESIGRNVNMWVSVCVDRLHFISVDGDLSVPTLGAMMNPATTGIGQHIFVDSHFHFYLADSWEWKQ